MNKGVSICECAHHDASCRAKRKLDQKQYITDHIIDVLLFG